MQKSANSRSTFFFFIFRNFPPKRCQGGRHLHCQQTQSVFEEDEAEEAAE